MKSEHRLRSRSFWLAFLIVLASIAFVWCDKMTGGQWVTLASIVLAAWQVGDKAEQVIAKRGEACH